MKNLDSNYSEIWSEQILPTKMLWIQLQIRPHPLQDSFLRVNSDFGPWKIVKVEVFVLLPGERPRIWQNFSEIPCNFVCLFQHLWLMPKWTLSWNSIERQLVKLQPICTVGCRENVGKQPDLSFIYAYTHIQKYPPKMPIHLRNYEFFGKI